mmetsp:Transcript_40191/g.110683  ORF Transcript_40191/g.110683 Transcript_40191/m.110683 type:complete len:271 (+) Transcript_40191:424-1236(+)
MFHVLRRRLARRRQLDRFGCVGVVQLDDHVQRLDVCLPCEHSQLPPDGQLSLVAHGGLRQRLALLLARDPPRRRHVLRRAPARRGHDAAPHLAKRPLRVVDRFGVQQAAARVQHHPRLPDDPVRWLQGRASQVPRGAQAHALADDSYRPKRAAVQQLCAQVYARLLPRLRDGRHRGLHPVGAAHGLQRRAVPLGTVCERALRRHRLRSGLHHRNGWPAVVQGVRYRHVGGGRRGAARRGAHRPRLRVQGQLQPEHRRDQRLRPHEAKGGV